MGEVDAGFAAAGEGSMSKCLSYPFSLFLLFSLLFAPPAPADPPKPIGPRIKVDQDRFDLGVVETSDAVPTPVRVTNVGDRPLTISPQFRKSTLEPGESTTISYRYTPRGNAGEINSCDCFYTNDSTRPTVKIIWVGEYRPIISIEPLVVQFGTVRQGNPGEALLTIRSRDPDFFVASVITGNDFIHATDVEVEEAPENAVYRNQATITFAVDPNAPTGSLSSTAKIKVRSRSTTNDPNTPRVDQELSVSLIAHVLGDILAEPRFIRVAQTFPGETFTEKIIISSTTGRNFTITSCNVVESTLPSVTARTQLVDETQLKGHYLILEGKGADTLGMFRGYVEITTDIPNESPLRIQFNGFTREKPR